MDVHSLRKAELQYELKARGKRTEGKNVEELRTALRKAVLKERTGLRTYPRWVTNVDSEIAECEAVLGTLDSLQEAQDWRRFVAVCYHLRDRLHFLISYFHFNPDGTKSARIRHIARSFQEKSALAMERGLTLRTPELNFTPDTNLHLSIGTPLVVDEVTLEMSEAFADDAEGAVGGHASIMVAAFPQIDSTSTPLRSTRVDRGMDLISHDALPVATETLGPSRSPVPLPRTDRSLAATLPVLSSLPSQAVSVTSSDSPLVDNLLDTMEHNFQRLRIPTESRSFLPPASTSDPPVSTLVAVPASSSLSSGIQVSLSTGPQLTACTRGPISAVPTPRSTGTVPCSTMTLPRTSTTTSRPISAYTDYATWASRHLSSTRNDGRLFSDDERERLARWNAERLPRANERRLSPPRSRHDGDGHGQRDAREVELQRLREQVEALQSQLSATRLSASQMEQTRRENVTIVKRDAQLHKWNLKFAGRKGESLFSFLEAVEDRATSRNVDDDALLKGAGDLFEGQALTLVRAGMARGHFPTWASLVLALQSTFLPRDWEDMLLDEIKDRKQGPDELIDIYVASMVRLFSRLTHPPSLASQLRIVWKNLHLFYLGKICLEDVGSIEELLTKGRVLEYSKQVADSRKNTDAKSYLLGPDLAYKGKKPDHKILVLEQSELPECWNCRQPASHKAKDCPEPQSKYCWKCGSAGKTVKTCPKCSKN